MSHELQLSPQQTEHVAPHLQSAECLDAAVSFDGAAISEPIANNPPKTSAKNAVFIKNPFIKNIKNYAANK